MQREYGTSSTSTVIHTIITWFFVINGLCHFFLAVALQPNSRNERISELWTPYSKTAKPEPYADAHAGSVPNSVVANSIVDKTSGSDRCDNVTLSNTSAISDGAHAQQDRLDDNVSRIEVASGTITAKIKGENSEMDNAAEVKAQELSSKNSNVHEGHSKSESCAGLGGPLTFMAVPLSALNILVLIILLLEVLVLFVDISTFMWFKGLDRGMIKHTRGAYEYAVRKSRIPGKASRFEVLLKGPLRRNGYIMALIPPLHILARVCSFNVSLYLRPNSRECHDNSKSKSKPHDKNC
ncbi:hypothetical protein SARC_03908 [Sphaeroforma arctica JP610]|uniref:Uncharacterized protein n=1 Tax=Sphaeroforma arctica JP610 TaxID=667725 RepID=A0A0L0G4V9_9EUKA|nr:hypothetical protein SARC_03908 [Sphaeroforma arctica JP610]KNC83851.1 hypothetical protein SARC_03908 [Sphaeroforma arctica JP610]|eukprot:XP_014157753.1 hypothetical protein SARC_03908 [Sphaeroforma arctica JP610]